jgi:hypothetical protein
MDTLRLRSGQAPSHEGKSQRHQKILSFVYLCALRGKCFPLRLMRLSREGHDPIQRKIKAKGREIRAVRLPNLGFESVWPLPIQNFWHVDAMLVDVLLVFNKFVADELFEMSAHPLQLGNSIHHVAGQMETIEVIQHRHIKWSRRRALFFIAAHVKVIVIMAAISEAMDQPRIPVISEDHRLIDGEQGIEVAVREAVRVFA